MKRIRNSNAESQYSTYKNNPFNVVAIYLIQALNNFSNWLQNNFPIY